MRLYSTGYLEIPPPTELIEEGTLNLLVRSAVIFEHGLNRSNSTDAARAFFDADQFADGCYATEFSVTIQDKNLYVIIPTIFDRMLHSPEESRIRYVETGEHMGKFGLTPCGLAQSEVYAQLLHERTQYLNEE